MKTPFSARRTGLSSKALFSCLILFLASLSVASAQWRRDFGADQSQQNQTAPAPQRDANAAAPASYSASQTVGQTTSMDVLNDTIKLSAGDILSYRVVEDGKEPIPVRVADSGDVEVPLIGRVAALDKTCRQLAYDIKAQLERSYYKKATVILGVDVLGGKSKGKITLMGDVHAQGEQEIPSDDSPFTVAKAILKAGGVGDFADIRKIKLIRKTMDGGYRTFIIDMKPVFKDGRLDKDPPVQPGDTVIVPEKLWNF